MKNKLLAFLAVGLLAGPMAAYATTVTIDPDDFDLGANLSNVAPGATLSWFTNYGGTVPRLDPIFAISPPVLGANGDLLAAPSGKSIFGNEIPGVFRPYQSFNLDHAQICIAYGDCTQEFAVFRADFEQGTNFVEVWTGFYRDQWIDGAFLDAYAADGTRLTSCLVAAGALSPTQTSSNACAMVLRLENCLDQPGNACNTYYNLSVNWTDPDIAYILFGGYRSATPNTVDRLTYGITESIGVPEPGSLALFTTAFAGLVFARRRKLN